MSAALQQVNPDIQVLQADYELCELAIWRVDLRSALSDPMGCSSAWTRSGSCPIDSSRRAVLLVVVEVFYNVGIAINASVRMIRENNMHKSRGATNVFRRLILVMIAAMLPALLAETSTARASERPHQERQIEIDIVPGTEMAPPGVELRLVSGVAPVESDTSPLPPRIELVDGTARLPLVPPTETPWTIHAQAPGFWSRPLTIGPESAPVERLVLWPAAELAGRMSPPEGERPPEKVEVRLLPISRLDEKSRDQPKGGAVVACVAENGQFSGCVVPAGRWNLRISADDFAPHFRWDVEIESGDQLRLGRIELERGGSVYGRMEIEGGEVDAERARVWARPAVAEARPVDPREESRSKQLIRLGEVGSDGSFQIVGLEAGRYEIRASQPGRVIAMSGPVMVERGRWTEIRQPLFLELPLRLALTIEPAKEPYGRPWSLSLYRVTGSGRFSLSAEGETDPSGFWRSPPIPPGTYQVEVRNAEDERLLRKELEVSAQTQSATIEIPLVYVEGELLLAGEPLQGTLWFGGRTGVESVEVASDELGEFFAVLPRPGTWVVDVHADSPTVRSRGLEVEVEEIEGLGLAEVSVEIPDTAVAGRVIDQHGRRPRSQVQVFLLALQKEIGPTVTRTDPEGEFAMHGVPPGEYQIGAETAGAASEVTRIEVARSLESFVELELRGVLDVTGRVLSEHGPVSGAEIRARPLTPLRGSAIPKTEIARTAPDGRFRVEVPAADAVRLIVKAPGYPLRVLRTSDPSELEILLDRQMGTVHFDGVESLVTVGQDRRVGIVMLDGEPLALSSLSKWAAGTGHGSENAGATEGRLSIPEMPPGNYALCGVDLQEGILILTGAALPSPDACREGFLSANGGLRLSPP